MTSSSPILDSTWRCLRYHLGSLAFGSFFIAILHTLQAILSYIQAKLEAQGNELMKCLVCCLQCITWCLDCCISKINRSGFVITAIYGTPYCPSSFTAVQLLLDKITYAGVITGMTEWILWLGKMIIAVG